MATELDPEKQSFSHPDFGFSMDVDKMNDYNIWAIIYDHVRLIPKYERLNNIIKHFAAKKQ